MAFYYSSTGKKQVSAPISVGIPRLNAGGSGSGGSRRRSSRRSSSSGSRQRAAERQRLLDVFNSSVAQRQSSYEQTRDELSADALEQARKAYVEHRIAGRGAAESLSAAGLRGGEADERLERLRRAYSDAVHRINRTQARLLAEAQRKRETGVAGDRQRYEKAISGL
ncbi:MAG: hypothetical protein RR320_03445 [Oscillospiraceae bacterium]